MEQKCCPICAEARRLHDTSVGVAGGQIHLCSSCGAYFLHPAVHVEYQDSGWSAKRDEKWQEDVQLALRHGRAIGDWFAATWGRPPRDVLEIGCGSGFMGKGFEAAGIEYVGIDVDRRSIDVARSRGVTAFEMAVEDFVSSHLRSRKFDLVISSNALEHVANPRRAFATIKNAVGGLAVVIVPNPEGLLPRLKANPIALKLVQKIVGNNRVIAFTIDGYWHNLAYSRATLRYLASLVGLRVQHLRTIGINDNVFGFVQRNETLLYRAASRILGALDLDSQLILVAS